MWVFRLGVAFAAWMVLAVSLLAQGGQGGGFGGGGMGAGPLTGDEVTQSLILTPGEKGEWVVDAKAGETIVATAKSTVFDPALEVVDEQGKVLASNDDEEPGIQSPRLAYRFPSTGKYRVWVKGYKSAAGGPFQMTLRKFESTLVESQKAVPLYLDDKGTRWLRVLGKKGQPFSVRVSVPSQVPGYEVLDPNGKAIDEESFASSQTRIDVRRVIDGEYYIKVHARLAAKALAEVSVEPISLFSVASGKPVPMRTLAPRSVELALLDVNPGDFVRIEAKSNGLKAGFSVESLESDQLPPFVSLVYDNRSKKGWATYLAKEKGTVAIAIYHHNDLPIQYQLAVANPVLALDSTNSRTLALGQIEYYRVEGKPGEIMRFQANSTDFDVHLRLLDADGARIAEADDSSNGTDAVITAGLLNEGPYYLAVACFGMGGKGAYRLVQEKIAPMELVPGKPSTKPIVADDTQIWSIKARKGQRVVLSVQSKQAGLGVQVVGPRGQAIRTLGDETAQLLTFSEDGTYTVWVKAKGSGEYRIQLIDLDS